MNRIQFVHNKSLDNPVQFLLLFSVQGCNFSILAELDRSSSKKEAQEHVRPPAERNVFLGGPKPKSRMGESRPNYLETIL